MPTLNRRRDNNLSSHRAGQNNRAFYQSGRWKTYSMQYRKRHRLCMECLKHGKTVLSQCVDHIVSIENNGDKWDEANHQALCHSCHSKKTKEERKR